MTEPKCSNTNALNRHHKYHQLIWEFPKCQLSVNGNLLPSCWPVSFNFVMVLFNKSIWTQSSKFFFFFFTEQHNESDCFSFQSHGIEILWHPLMHIHVIFGVLYSANSDKLWMFPHYLVKEARMARSLYSTAQATVLHLAITPSEINIGPSVLITCTVFCVPLQMRIEQLRRLNDTTAIYTNLK